MVAGVAGVAGAVAVSVNDDCIVVLVYCFLAELHDMDAGACAIIGLYQSDWEMGSLRAVCQRLRNNQQGIFFFTTDGLQFRHKRTRYEKKVDAEMEVKQMSQ